VWLEQHGWAGLAAFKAVMVGVFVGAVYLLARRRPQVGAAVVTLGCAVLVSVNFYSGGLIRQTARAQEAAHKAAEQEAKPWNQKVVGYVPVKPAGVR
jgi:hypothetical protein